MDKGKHEQDLNYISSYLLSVFEFASVSKSTVFDKTEWLSFSPTDGEWLYSLYDKDTKNGRLMRQALNRLFAMKAEERAEIYHAIEHDMKFAENRSEGFRFESILLKEEARSLIHDFFLYFYEVVLRTAHFELQNVSGHKYGRAEFAKAYFSGDNKSIKHVCSVCLQGMTDAQKEADIEHYFAKSWIPCLALHPYNLYFICPVCNERYKLADSPFYDGNTDLGTIFLPYLDTVRDKVRIEFTHGMEKDQVRLSPADQREEHIDEKVKAFDKLFSLKDR